MEKQGPQQANNNIIPFDGEAYLYDQFFAKSAADEYFRYLQNEIAWKQSPITVFGKQYLQPRLTAFYGDKNKQYRYSGVEMSPYEWNPVLIEIKNKVEQVAGVNFTSALLNFYRNGQDSMGWHRDNEKELSINPVVASVSLGAKRNFRFRNYLQKKISQSIALTHGSLLLMKGTTQHFWEHQVPKTSVDPGPRINITFRIIYSRQ